MRKCLFWVSHHEESVTDALFEAIEEPEIDDQDAGMTLAQLVGGAIGETETFFELMAPGVDPDEVGIGAGFHTGDAAACEAFLVEHGAKLVPASDLIAKLLFIHATIPIEGDDGVEREPVWSMALVKDGEEVELEKISPTDWFAVERTGDSIELIHEEERRTIDLSGHDGATLQVEFA